MSEITLQDNLSLAKEYFVGAKKVPHAAFVLEQSCPTCGKLRAADTAERGWVCDTIQLQIADLEVMVTSLGQTRDA